MRRKYFDVVFLLLGAAVHASPIHAETIIGDAARGKNRSKAEQCQECHGEAGQGTAEHFPKLAGQWAAYIRKQLGDFQSGARKSEIMTAMASGLSRQDIADIAAYFSSAPRWDAEQTASSALGQRLYQNGDSSRGLPACQSCHGVHGRGGDADDNSVPAVGAQRQSYLTNQLHAWKVDDRENSRGGVMNDVAHRLDDVEIEALAKYLSGLRAAE